MTPATVAPTRLEDLRTLRWAILDVAFATSFATLVGGSFLFGFVKHLGGGDTWVGYFGAIAPFMGLLQLLGAQWGRSFSSYKRYVAPGGFLWRLFFVPLVLLPLLPSLAPEIKLTCMLLCLGLAAACQQMVDPIYNDWMAELVPPNSRGVIFARRTAVSSITGAVVGLIGGVILDAFRSAGHTEVGFSVIYGLGILCAVISLVFFNRMGDKPRLHPVPMNLKGALAQVAAPYRDGTFRRVMLFLFAFIAGQAFVGGLLVAFCLEILRMPFALLQLTGVFQAIGILISAKWWGLFVDKYGNKPVLAILCFGLGLTPLMWFVCQPGNNLWNAAVLIPGHVFSGLIWGGVGSTQLNLILATSPSDKRASYVAAGQSLIQFTAAIAPFIGGFVMSRLRPEMGAAQAYLVVLGICAGLRFLSVLFLLPVREKGSLPIRETLRELRSASPKGFRAFRRLSTSPDVATRATAMEEVAAGNVGFATDELIKSLHDPTPRLRRQAAAALAKLGDERAVSALVHMLEEHPDLIEEETIHALGLIGHEDAVVALVRFLNSPRPQIRRAAARALGRIGGEAAETALIGSAADTQDPDLRRAALQALRTIGSARCHPVIAEACSDQRPSVRIAASEAVEELLVREAAPQLRESIARFRDEATSEVAYALGTVGDVGDLAQIIEVANDCESIITRRRALLGAARLLGVEQATYRLFLLEGLARDSAFLSELGPAAERNQRLRDALHLYSAGDEAAAMARLTSGEGTPKLRALAIGDDPEVFLIAALAFAQTLQTRRMR
jgi:HEAT repeat protein